MAIKTIFLDRDGVINKEVGYLKRIEDFIFIDGVFESCLSFKKLDYQIIIISNQSGIARGYFTLFEYEKLTKWMLNQFSKKNISILDVFFCPHGPKSECGCRKPKPGMYINIADRMNIDLTSCYAIGDSPRDIEAARAVDCKALGVLTGNGIEIQENNKYDIPIFTDLYEAAEFVISQ